MASHELIWRALEGALGSEKVAYLQNASLPDLLGARDDFSVADAAGHVAKHAHTRKRETRAIRDGIKAAAALGIKPKKREMSLTQKIKIAAAVAHPAFEGHEKIAHTKKVLYKEIVDGIKEAAVGGILDGVSKNPVLREAGKKLLGGAAVGTGLAIPGYAAASALSDDFTEDARNRALQTAAGVGGLALMGYGGKKLIDDQALDAQRRKNYAAMDQYRRGVKMSSVQEPVLGQIMDREKAAHLATACYLDELLDSVAQTEKVAAVRELNREFIVEELLTKEAETRSAIRTSR